MDDTDRDTDNNHTDRDITDLTLYQPRRRGFRMWEAREALGISQKTLVDWLRRAGYDLDEVVERADVNDLRQRYVANEIVEDLAERHARKPTLERWLHIRDLEVENDQLRRRVGELELEMHALRILLEQSGGSAAKLKPAAKPKPVSAPPLQSLPARSKVITRPLRPIAADNPNLADDDDRRFPLAACPPLPAGWMAYTTICQKHNIFIRSMDELVAQEGGPTVEENPRDVPPWRSGSNRVRRAYTPEQHLAACIRMADKWPQRFVPSCGPKCPYPDYLARHPHASVSSSVSSENE